MYKRTMETKWFRAFLLFFPFLILSSLQQEAFSKTHDESLGKIQWCAVRNTKSNEKYATATSSDIILMGAFATSTEPTSLPISLEFEFSTYKEFYMGIVIINDSGNDKDITARFELTGPRGGKEEEDITVPANYTYIAYIKDIFGRPDIYTFKGSIKDVGSSKIKMLFTE
ncbi:MAG TPA: hypothetical protein ACFYEK_09510 [Candidatus Wunengus sp. YC60]|uniref:hypothetical protein n=1 Tax=Candidatus Wunengus sp. YC60 TaxID=3367697 RepID=UPI00402787A3